MTDVSFKIWIYVTITGYNVDSSEKFAYTIIVHYSNRLPRGNKYIQNFRDPYANLLSQAPHTAICRRYLQIVYNAVLNLVLFSTI